MLINAVKTGNLDYVKVCALVSYEEKRNKKMAASH